mmetsp:Transcript_85986/g.149991  ORF Transcript_85986/g.149991 Transcript_85986/m.149991 type:complete len:234 (-) Transcript_85986:118-819(-)
MAAPRSITPKLSPPCRAACSALVKGCSTYSATRVSGGGRPRPSLRRWYCCPRCCSTDRNPLWPPHEPRLRNRTLPNGRSRSSQTTSTSSALSCRSLHAAATDAPQQFMGPPGSNRWTVGPGWRGGSPHGDRLGPCLRRLGGGSPAALAAGLRLEAPLGTGVKAGVWARAGGGARGRSGGALGLGSGEWPRAIPRLRGRATAAVCPCHCGCGSHSRAHCPARCSTIRRPRLCRV